MFLLVNQPPGCPKIKYVSKSLCLETSLPGALEREFWRFMRILATFLGKTHRIHQNSHKRPKHPNYDGFLWVLPRSVVRIRMHSRNSLYNTPGKEGSYTCYKLMCIFCPHLWKLVAENHALKDLSGRYVCDRNGTTVVFNKSKLLSGKDPLC